VVRGAGAGSRLGATVDIRVLVRLSTYEGIENSFEQALQGVREHPLGRANQIRTPRVLGCQADDDGRRVGQHDPRGDGGPARKGRPHRGSSALTARPTASPTMRPACCGRTVRFWRICTRSARRCGRRLAALGSVASVAGRSPLVTCEAWSVTTMVAAMCWAVSPARPLCQTAWVCNGSGGWGSPCAFPSLPAGTRFLVYSLRRHSHACCARMWAQR